MDSEMEEDLESVDFCMSRPCLALVWPKRRTFGLSSEAAEPAAEPELEPPQAASDMAAALAPATAEPLRKSRRVRLI